MTGLDASPAMVAAARARGLNVHQLSATAMEFDAEFDAVFSNAALHWMPNADAVLRAVHQALKPGGRFVAEMGGQGNIAAIRVALQAVLATVWHRCGESGRQSLPFAGTLSPAAGAGRICRPFDRLNPQTDPTARRNGGMAEHLPQWCPGPPEPTRPGYTRWRIPSSC